MSLRFSFTFLLILSLCIANSAQPGQTLPGTRLLDWQDDIASRLIDSCDAFLLQEIEKSIAGRGDYWHRDFSSDSAYELSVDANRESLGRIIGLKEERIAFLKPELLGLVAVSDLYEVHAGRWPVFGRVHGEGLIVFPRHTPVVRGAVVIPDADQSPEDVLGLTGSLSPKLQTARAYVEKGFLVVIPSLINRYTTHGQISNREFINRSAFELGRHIIGYEVQKVMAAVDWLTKIDIREITVSGWGEGGLLALYAGALDKRIDETKVGGYFGSRQEIWQEPAYRNIYGLLEQFGDAEISSLIAPRKLVINSDSEYPGLVIPPGTGAKPGRLTGSPATLVDLEINRLKKMVSGLDWEVRLESLPLPEGDVANLREIPDTGLRHQKQMTELDDHNQWLLRESAYQRKEFMSGLKFDSIGAFLSSVEPYRDYFAREVIGQFDIPLTAFNTRSRRYPLENKDLQAYEIVIDVFAGIFAYGILILPPDLKPGEKRPVVVCQHGLEGRPQSTLGEKDYRSYQAFAAKLAERGYITFAPQNLYIFGDRFRSLQFKANSIKKTLFSIMVPQHQQIINWLSDLSFVDANRIAFYGLSYGGKSAMRIPPLVPGYCLSICSADFNEWVWKNASTRSPYSYVWTGEYEIFEWDLGSTFNYSEMAALIAPRPFMVERGHFDGVAPDEMVGYEYAKVRHLYNAKLNIGDRTEIEWFAGPHTINGKGTFNFLDKHLHFTPTLED